MAVEDERRQLEAVRITLQREFENRVAASVVDQHFAEIVARFSDAPVRTFLPVLVHRQTRQRLASTGQSQAAV